MDNNKTAINHLFWAAEELKAYTDLTGNRFDIAHAQRRLWPINRILSKHNFPEIQKRYNTLEELLEQSMFFDKIGFSKKVDELFTLLESMR